MKNLREKVEIILYSDNKEVLNELKAKLLLLISKSGSILSASKALGIPYSRAWEYILKIENILGVKIIEARRGGRGGGGTNLTKDGFRLLNRYLRSYRQFFGSGLSISIKELVSSRESYIYAGSDDLLVKELISILRKDGIGIENYYVGSMGGVSSLMLEEADFTGVHLYDPSEDEYNLPYIRKYTLAYPLILIRGYYRLQGFVSKQLVQKDEILDMLFDKKFKFINRNPGSGTRILIDYVLEKAKKERRLKGELKDLIRGYDKCVYTHLEVASKVADGSADIGVCLEASAKYYNLYFVPVKWERFDFVVRDDDRGRRLADKISNILISIDFRRKIGKYLGYRCDDDIGKTIRFK